MPKNEGEEQKKENRRIALWGTISIYVPLSSLLRTLDG